MIVAAMIVSLPYLIPPPCPPLSRGKVRWGAIYFEEWSGIGEISLSPFELISIIKDSSE
jgi:hypothetical protein